jgi:hypothetical protein
MSNAKKRGGKNESQNHIDVTIITSPTIPAVIVCHSREGRNPAYTGYL